MIPSPPQPSKIANRQALPMNGGVLPLPVASTAAASPNGLPYVTSPPFSAMSAGPYHPVGMPMMCHPGHGKPSTHSMRRDSVRVSRAQFLEERHEREVLQRGPCMDSVKDTIRRNLQKRIRLKMIRKGQIPPNPTVDELQMCGLQPIPVPYSMPCYYNPYDGQSPGAPSPYLHAPPHMPQQYLPAYMLNRPQPRRPAAPPARQLSPTVIIEFDSATSSQLTMSPHSHMGAPQPLFDFRLDDEVSGLFATALVQEASHLASTMGMEPFLLPDMEHQTSGSAFDNFFGGDEFCLQHDHTHQA